MDPGAAASAVVTARLIDALGLPLNHDAAVCLYAGLVTDPRVAVIRVDGPLYFANAQQLQDLLLALAEQRASLTAIVLDASAISDTDTDGAHILTELHERLADRSVALHLATIRGPVRDLLTRAGVWQPLREAGRIHRDITDAVTATGTADATGDRPDRPALAGQEVL